jgi:hypothetical protein
MIALLMMAVLAQEPPPPPGAPPRRPREGRPPGGEPFPPGEPMPDHPPVNPDEVKAWLKENEPETFQRLQRAQEEGRRPDILRLMGEAGRRMREAADMKERDPKAFARMQDLRKLERESLELAEKARIPAEREAASAKLKETLAKLFDLREETKAREIGELKRRVADLEKQLEARKAGKERIVERRKRELLGERPDDEW